MASHTTTRAVTARLVARQGFSADIDYHSVSATSLGIYITSDTIKSVATWLTYPTFIHVDSCVWLRASYLWSVTNGHSASNAYDTSKPSLRGGLPDSAASPREALTITAIRSRMLLV